MKRLIFIVMITSLSWCEASADILTYIGKVYGPVKKMTVTSNQYGLARTWVYKYDSIGRLTEYAYYNDGKLQTGCYVRQYTNNNTYSDLYYDEKGIIKGTYRQTWLDSEGHEIYSKRYKEGKLYAADSTVYNKKGLETKHYHLKDGVLVLQYSNEYDSLGRLSAHMYSSQYPDKEHKWKYEYLSNGNYIEHRTTKYLNKSKEEYSYKKFIFNGQGRLEKIEGSDEESRFLNFDHHGNWTIWKEKLNIPIGRYNYTYLRTFEYYDNASTNNTL